MTQPEIDKFADDAFEAHYPFTDKISHETAFSKNEARLYNRVVIQSLFELGKPILEIGLQFGRSTSIVLQAMNKYVREVSFPNMPRYVGCDPFIEPPEAYDAWKAMTRTLKYPETTLLTSRSENLCVGYAPDTFGLILVDGDHSYLGVRLDALTALKLTAVNGYILFHDYDRASLPDVTRAVNDWNASHADGRVMLIDRADTLAVFKKVA